MGGKPFSAVDLILINLSHDFDRRVRKQSWSRNLNSLQTSLRVCVCVCVCASALCVCISVCVCVCTCVCVACVCVWVCLCVWVWCVHVCVCVFGCVCQCCVCECLSVCTWVCVCVWCRCGSRIWSGSQLPRQKLADVLEWSGVAQVKRKSVVGVQGFNAQIRILPHSRDSFSLIFAVYVMYVWVVCVSVRAVWCIFCACGVHSDTNFTGRWKELVEGQGWQWSGWVGVGWVAILK